MSILFYDSLMRAIEDLVTLNPLDNDIPVYLENTSFNDDVTSYVSIKTQVSGELVEEMGGELGMVAGVIAFHICTPKDSGTSPNTVIMGNIYNKYVPYNEDGLTLFGALPLAGDIREERYERILLVNFHYTYNERTTDIC